MATETWWWWHMPDTNVSSMTQRPDDQPVPSSMTPELYAALNDTARLLEHAASSGLFPMDKQAGSDTMVRDLIWAQEAARSGRLTPQIITAFWNAYGRLGHLVRPVTAATLAASKRASLLGMKIQSAVLVAALIIFSIFLFMCNATLSETSDLMDQQNSVALKLWADIQVLRTNGPGNGDASHVSSGGAVIAERVFEETVEFSRKSVWLLQSAGRLNFWFTPWWMQSGIKDVTFNESNPNRMTHLNVPPTLSSVGEIQDEAIYQIRAYQSIRDYALGLFKINTLIYNSLSTYFLPTVYALLGAFLYGFRLCTRLIRRKAYLPCAAYSARYFIAAIAGLVVGLFGSLLPKGLAMPPLAVAFLVGYAVEAFFSRLDGLIHKFKGDEAAPSAPRAKAPAAASGQQTAGTA
jgi:hypothetical protein